MYSCGGFVVWFYAEQLWTAIETPSLDLGHAAVSITVPTNELWINSEMIIYIASGNC